MTRARPVWRAALAASVLAVIAGCAAARPPARGAIPAPDKPDSALTREEAMIDDGNLDGAGAAGLADASNDAAAIQHLRNAIDGETIEIEAVTGFRSDVRVRWRAPAGLSGGARVYEDGVSGFVRFEGKGIVRAVHAGRIAVRA
ncbi:MAG: hypothetical protein H6Q78_366, partial [Candidatus Krumholzibacteriota bacterium]|nr:hypothetical protein [Candidatus Krumholzibacteriota bacterium]